MRRALEGSLTEAEIQGLRMVPDDMTGVIYVGRAPDDTHISLVRTYWSRNWVRRGTALRGEYERFSKISVGATFAVEEDCAFVHSVLIQPNSQGIIDKLSRIAVRYQDHNRSIVVPLGTEPP